ncbi:Variant surface glycoprotein [Trypanosoma congolense IL3000]|uniref:Variant surface glycoprotein n=1 Tax=Trypanosoma congolense (strain IL3000) TaxID=1068625 RepID=F9WFN5_TRYCI|nr:Variant surface glycoprotein [Trypanosoma congolense IL3000]
MWGNVLIVFILSHYSVKAVNCHNEVEQKLLCDIFRQSGRVLQKYEDAELIEEAIYGPTDNNAQIINFGNVTLGTSCHTPVLRDAFCRYLGGERVENGCFAESLLGTFFCVCAPGARRGYVDKLCGVSIKPHVDSWFGSIPLGQDKIEELFDSVWGYVIRNCTGVSESVGSGNEELEKLRKAVEEIENTIKPDRNGFFYLGGSVWKDCSGLNGRDVCAAYKKKDGSDSKAHIPWVEKIKEAITHLQKVERERQDLDFRQITAGKHGESITAPIPRAGEGNAELTDQSEGIVTPPNSNEAPSKTKISTKISPLSDIPHLATYFNENDSPLTNQKWLVIAAFLN